MQTVFREVLFETFPDTLGLLAVSHYAMGFVGKQGQLFSLSQQKLWLLLEEEAVEHGCQQTIKRIIEHVNDHSSKSSVSCCSAAARFCWAFESRRGRRRSGRSSLMPMTGCEKAEVSSPQVMKYLAFFITTPIFLR